MRLSAPEPGPMRIEPLAAIPAKDVAYAGAGLRKDASR